MTNPNRGIVVMAVDRASAKSRLSVTWGRCPDSKLTRNDFLTATRVCPPDIGRKRLLLGEAVMTTSSLQRGSTVIIIDST